MLWDDIRRHADLSHSGRRSSPHFLGAVVLQNQSSLKLVGDCPGHRMQLARAAQEGTLFHNTFKQKRFGEVQLIHGADVQFANALRVMARRGPANRTISLLAGKAHFPATNLQ